MFSFFACLYVFGLETALVHAFSVPQEKKLSICVFQFPPDKGNVGTAAYLDVFGSIYAVMKELKKQGEGLQGLQSAA